MNESNRRFGERSPMRVMPGIRGRGYERSQKMSLGESDSDVGEEPEDAPNDGALLDEEHEGSYYDLRIVDGVFIDIGSGRLKVATRDRDGEREYLFPEPEEVDDLIDTFDLDQSSQIDIGSFRDEIVRAVLVVQCFPHSMDGPRVISQLRFDGTAVYRDTGF